MIYEYREYKAMPGKRPALVEMMGKAMPLFEKHGIKVVGCWTPAVSEDNSRFIYILAFDDMGHREKAFTALFVTDPEWRKIAAEASKEGPLTTVTSNSFLSPTPYSPAH